MAVWNLINPSDPYTLVTDNFEVATVVCLLLGEGRYGLEEINGERRVPLMLFDVNERWFRETFGCTCQELFDRMVGDRRAEIVACLDSVLIGSPASRATYQEGLDLIDDPQKRAAWRTRWHDKRQSSMNDIGAQARRLADQIRKVITNESAAREGVSETRESV